MQVKVKSKLPKRDFFNPTSIEKELNHALIETADELKKLFINTQLDFDKPVTFEINYELGAHKATVFTEDENYNRLNSGTSAHMIYPAPGGVLVFPDAFGRKTNPGQLYSMSGYKSNNFVFTRGPVLNPGFPARAFDKAIAKKIRPILKRKIQAALLRAFKT